MGNAVPKLTRREQYGLAGFAVILTGVVLGSGACSRLGSPPLKPVMKRSQAGSIVPLTAESPTPMPTPKPELVVSVIGAVKKPGIYKFKEGQRFYEAIESAGGFLPEAQREALNLADRLRDGDQLNVPAKTRESVRDSEPPTVTRARKTSRKRGATQKSTGVPPVPVHLIARPVESDSEPDEGDPEQPKGESLKSIFKSLGLEDSSTSDSGETESSKSRTRESLEDSLVDINKADAEELTQLPGVGPATAERILKYRREKGEFEFPEDLMEVRGIGPKTFAKMKRRVSTE